jgi:hypothetical protein
MPEETKEWPVLNFKQLKPANQWKSWNIVYDASKPRQNMRDESADLVAFSGWREADIARQAFTELGWRVAIRHTRHKPSWLDS